MLRRWSALPLRRWTTSALATNDHAATSATDAAHDTWRPAAHAHHAGERRAFSSAAVHSRISQTTRAGEHIPTRNGPVPVPPWMGLPEIRAPQPNKLERVGKRKPTGADAQHDENVRAFAAKLRRPALPPAVVLPPPVRPPSDNPTCFDDFGSALAPALAKLGKKCRTMAPCDQELRFVSTILQHNDYAAFTALSPAAAAYLFMTLALAQLSPSLVGPVGIRMRPSHWKRIWPQQELHMFLKRLVHRLETQLPAYKERPLDAALARSVRSTLHAVYLSVHAMGAADLAPAFAEKERQSNWRRRREEQQDPDLQGGNSIKINPFNRFDPLLFPHIAAVHPHNTIPLLVRLEDLMLDHLDLFIWPPGTTINDDVFREQEQQEGEKKADEVHGGIQTEQKATPAVPDVVLDPSMPAVLARAEIVCNNSCNSSTPTFYPEETPSYPHHRPWRNVLAWVRALQSVRGGYASHRAIRALLRVTGEPLTLLNIMRQRRRPGFAHFGRSREDMVRAKLLSDDQVAAVEPIEETEDSDTAAIDAAEEKDAALEAFEEPALDAQDREDQQQIQQMEREAAEPDSVQATAQSAESPSIVPSSDLAAPAAAAAAAASSSSPLQLGSRTSMWTGARLRDADMLCLVEAWAINNCNTGMSRTLKSMLHWLKRRTTNSAWCFLSLIEMIRLMECFSMMEWHHPLLHGLTEQFARFIRGGTDHPIGQPLDIMTVLATDVQHMRGGKLIDVFMQQGKEPEAGSSNADTSSATSSLPTSEAPSPPIPFLQTLPVQTFRSVFDQEPLDSIPPRAPLLFAHLLSALLRRYGPLAIMRCDLSMLSESDLPKMEGQLEPNTRMLMGSVRAMCDYFIRIMQDDDTGHAMRVRYVSSSIALSSRADSPAGEWELVQELTDFAWSLVLRQLERFEVVRHFMHAYIQFVERNFTVETIEGRCYLTHHSGMQLEPNNLHRVLYRMHQVSLSILIARPRTVIQSAMPRTDPAPALPAEFNFSAGTRDAILHFLKSQGSGDRSVSSLQMQVYQVMTDPQHGMGFRQRVMHDHASITMNRQTARHHSEKEQQLNAAWAQQQPSQSSWQPESASDEGDNLLRLYDRMSPSELAAELTSEQSAVDMFVEHSTAIGYTLDAAIVMRSSDPKLREAKDARRQQRLTDLPAIRALLPDHVAPSVHTISVALEIDGPWHFARSSFVMTLNAASRLRRRHLQAHGWRVISVPFFTWNALDRDVFAQAAFLRNQLPPSMLRDFRLYRQQRQEERREKGIARTQKLRQLINEVGSTMVTSPQHATKLLRAKFATRHTAGPAAAAAAAAAAASRPHGVTAGRKFRPTVLAPEESTNTSIIAAPSTSAPAATSADSKQARLRAILDKFSRKLGSGSG